MQRWQVGMDKAVASLASFVALFVKMELWSEERGGTT
jgi:hypothetical protein